jgi:two-component system nitrate/nitrite response regulator NarL
MTAGADMERIKVLLVDPHQLSREGLKRLLDCDRCHVTGEASSLDDAQGLIDDGLEPELLVVALEDQGGNEQVLTIQRLRDAFSRYKTILIANNISRPLLTQALGAGIKACLLRDMSTEALTQSLHLVMLGQQVFPTRVTMMLLGPQAHRDGQYEAAQNGPELPARMRGLSAREAEILRFLLNGYSNKSIARSLGISEATVKVHLKALLRKVNAQNRTQAAVWALANGFAEHASTSAEPKIA